MPNDDIAAAFVASGGAKLPQREPKAAKGLTRSAPKPRKRGLREASPKQQDKKRTWAFIKHCFITCQLRTLGYIQCMRCGAINPSNVQLHHMEHAGKGGEWTPQNAELICAGPGSCHAKEHGEPEWGRTA